METIKTVVRTLMQRFAAGVDRLSGGTITPNMVTVAGLFGHIPIFWLIIDDRLLLAGMLLVAFGLFDTLDGELARLQKRTSPVGMFLDSFTDRVKEVLIYVAVGWWLLYNSVDTTAVVAVIAAAGVSVIISYLNAWGEVVLQKQDIKHTVNKTFRGGIMGFEIRMFTLAIGLLTGHVAIAIWVILLLGIVTATQRFVNIIERLTRV